jgi:hypothetical protein
LALSPTDWAKTDDDNIKHMLNIARLRIDFSPIEDSETMAVCIRFLTVFDDTGRIFPRHDSFLAATYSLPQPRRPRYHLQALALDTALDSRIFRPMHAARGYDRSDRHEAMRVRNL